MSDNALQEECFLWGAIGVSVLLAQCSPAHMRHILVPPNYTPRSTYPTAWGTQGTLPLRSRASRKLWARTEGQVYSGQIHRVNNRCDNGVYPRPRFVCHISLATQIQWANDTGDSSTQTWNKHLSFPSLNINSLQSGITWTDVCRQTILHVFCIALFKMCMYLFLPMFQSLLIVTAIRLSQQTFLLL